MNSPLSILQSSRESLPLHAGWPAYHTKHSGQLHSFGGILDQQPELFLERYRSSCNSKGMLDAQDVVGALMFLLSEQSTFITGQNIIVDDGWSL